LAAPHQVTVGDLLYTVVDDCTTTYWALLTGSVTDEILGELYAPDFTVVTGRADLQLKKTANGLFALTGYPEVSFPNHGANSYNLNLQLKAPGFRELSWIQPVPAGQPFPIVILPKALRRLPVRIQGRVVNDLTRVPISGAQVLCLDDPLTPPTVHTTAMRAPLYFDHALPAQAQNVNMISPIPTSLSADVARGDLVLNLSACNGAGPNPVLKLFNASQTIVEYAVVDHFGPGAPGPGQAFLRNALNHSYSQSATTATFFTPNPVGGVANLSSDANAGDGVLLANQLLNGASTLVVDAGSLIAEYHEVGALTDSDGYYSLDGMGRVPEIFLFSTQGGLQQTVPWFIEYDRAINVVDLRLS
jgi:hypothetical protein